MPCGIGVGGVESQLGTAKSLKIVGKTGIVVTMLDDRSYMRTDSRPTWSATIALMIALVVCFLIQIFVGPAVHGFNEVFMLSMDGLKQGRFYELITFQFMHSGFMHLAGNLLGLYFFGASVEASLGRRQMLILYFLAGSIGGLLQVGLGAVIPGQIGLYLSGPVVGASAGVYGLIAAFATRAPDQPISMLILFVIPVTFLAKVFIYIEASIAILGILRPMYMPPWAHGAHLGGMITGILFVKWLNRPHSAIVVWKPERRKPQLVSNAPKRANWRKPRKKLEDVPPGEFISKEVYPILEKISAHGIHSLTDQERKILEAARDKMAKR